MVLEEVLARPGLSFAQVAAIFEARTGRKINRSSVDKRRRQGPYKTCPGNRHLSEVERGELHRLIREGNGQVNYREIADQFEAITGRRITYQVAWSHATKILGLPGAGKGHGPRVKFQAVERRQSLAAARKLATARVDRSVRVGRVGRLHRIGGDS